LQVGNNWYDVLHALLPGKKKETYLKMWEAIKEEMDKRGLIVSIELQTATDYEESIAKSAKEVWPWIVMCGCYTHFGRALISKVEELGLKTVYIDDPKMRLAVRRFLALGAVPAVYKDEAFQILKKRYSSYADLKPFVEYFEKQWVKNKNRPLEMWDFSIALVYTTNTSEAKHRWYKSEIILVPQRNVYAVVVMLLQRHHRQLPDLEKEDGPDPPPSKQRKEHKKSEKNLRREIEKFCVYLGEKEGPIEERRCISFLDNVAYLIPAIDTIMKKERKSGDANRPAPKKLARAGSDGSRKPAPDASMANNIVKLKQWEKEQKEAQKVCDAERRRMAEEKRRERGAKKALALRAPSGLPPGLRSTGSDARASSMVADSVPGSSNSAAYRNNQVCMYLR
jgi:hypothetical protein